MPNLKYFVPAPVRAFRWRFRSLVDGEANSRRKVIRTGQLVRWTVKELMTKQFMFTTPDGSVFETMANNYSSLVTFMDGHRDPGLRRFIESHLSSKDVFVDVGANIGSYTVRAAQHLYPHGRVVAIEAHPATFTFLKRNLALNSLHNVVALNLAVGSRESEIRLNSVSGNPGETHVATSKTDNIVAVRLRSLDAVLNELGIDEIHYLKIDVEGFEVEALNGAGSIIRRSPRIVVQTEVVPGHLSRYGASVTKLASVAHSYGLIPHCLGSGGCLEPMKLSETITASEVLWLHATGRPA